LNGVVIIDKPKRWTSHDVVAQVRRILRVRKAGHGGTLDPLATGVLPVYLNEGTKLVPFNLESTKEYAGQMKLGEETDTLDADGKIVAEKRGFFFNPKEIEEVFAAFRGKIRQTPPLFSAIKQDGLPLYKYVRAGEIPRLMERETFIYALKLREVSLPFIRFEVTCARGTYIRSLCADMGRVMGCGAHLTELRRMRSGKFTLEQAVSLEDLSRLAAQDKVTERIISLKDGLPPFPAIYVEEKTGERVRQGQPLRLGDLSQIKKSPLKIGERVCLLLNSGHLLAIAESQVNVGGEMPEHREVLRILRVFNH
jgi:tRNA pseudouridine55 synthase